MKHYLLFLFFSTANYYFFLPAQTTISVKTGLPKFKVAYEPSTFSMISPTFCDGSSDAAVRTVGDINGNFFIVKQIRKKSLGEQFLLINDFVASTIGYHYGINVNDVILFPASLACDYKIFNQRAATLHTKVPGLSIQENFPSLELPVGTSFCIQQRVNSLWQSIPNEKMGLTQEVIESMTMHDDLPTIVALDTLIGNIDRSFPNIFYDGATDHFYGIDHGAAFTQLLPSLAILRINELQERGYFNKCHEKVIYALKKYRETLRLLTQPEVEQMILYKFISLAQNLLPYPQTLPKKIAQRIQFHSNIVQQNFHDTRELILLLDSILGH